MKVHIANVKKIEMLRDRIIKNLEHMKGTSTFSVSCYHNGRENGFKIHNLSIKNNVTFSENRNSDKIVVYLNSSLHEFTITDKAFKTAKYFARNDHDDFVKFCLSHLTGQKIMTLIF